VASDRSRETSCRPDDGAKNGEENHQTHIAARLHAFVEHPAVSKSDRHREKHIDDAIQMTGRHVSDMSPTTRPPYRAKFLRPATHSSLCLRHPRN
jgi:hypothetical protein